MSTLDRFSYDRVGLTAGIVHIGVGGFHRAHQAAVIDDLLGRGLSSRQQVASDRSAAEPTAPKSTAAPEQSYQLSSRQQVASDRSAAEPTAPKSTAAPEQSYNLVSQWAICGVGVMPADERMRDTLRAQDFRYTLVLKHPDGARTAREIGSIVDYLYAPDDPIAVVERMASPEIRIVSLTITEGGYHFDRVTGEFDPSGASVSRDLLPGAVPSTAFGLIAEALRRRRDRGLAPFTVLSCDNIPGNGNVCRRMLSAFASAKDPGLGAWIGEHVAFPNSMVDRITPATTDTDRVEVAAEFGVEDCWPVVAEPFFQWVIEDDFPCGRPPWEQAGVQMVADVEPYELMKLRLLNSSHQGLCYFGRLSGYRYVHEAAQDPLIANLLRRYMDEEATPTLHPVPGIDLDGYKETLMRRFGNPQVRDTIARLCADSSDRIPTWLVPVVREQLAAGRPVRLSAAIVASWARYAEGVDEQGRPIEVVDRLRDKVMEHAARQRATPTAFLGQRDLFGDLADDERFVSDYLWALDSLIHRGAQATLAAL